MYIFFRDQSTGNKAKETNKQKTQTNLGNSMHIQYSYAEGEPV